MSGVQEPTKEQANAEGSPSVLAREGLHRLLSGGADRESNIVSALDLT